MPVIRASEVIIGNNSPETPKLGHAIPKDRLLDELDDAELDAVRGGARTDPGDDDDKMSGGELAVLYRSRFGVKLQQSSL